MPRVKRTLRRFPVLYLALGVLFAVAVTYRLRDTADRLDEVVRGDRLVRLPFDVDFPDSVVSQLTPEAVVAGLHAGERIVAVNGMPLHSLVEVIDQLLTSRPGDPLLLTVQAVPPAVDRRTIGLTLAAERQGPPTAYHWVRFAIGSVALPYLCLALGFWVAAVRIHDRLAWLVLLVVLGLAEFVGGNWRTLFGYNDWFQPIAMVYQPLFGNLWPVGMMLFGIYFPDRLAFDRRFPWVKWIVLAPVLFRVLGTNVATDILVLRDPEAAARVARMFAPMLPLVGVLHFAAVGVFFAAGGYRAFRERRPDLRRRLMLLHAGAAVALTPLCLLAVLLIAGTIEFADWMLLPAYALLFVFPATMAYVIVVQRAMDVRLVIRQGVQYLLARGSIRVVAIGASIVVAMAVFEGWSSAGDPTMRLAVGSLGLAGIAAIGRFADRLRVWLDRRFFREAYNAEQILSDLAAKVRTMVETGPLLETVAHQVASSLHIPRVAILLNGGGELRPAYAIGYADLPHLPLRPDPFSEAHERELRAALEAEVVLPFSANHKLIGVMGLGAKQSEEPFSSADIRLLDAVATQTGLALENSRLTAEIATEVATREKVRRELEIAREVQERLFPQALPPISGIEYDGTCRPALGVGGDYYDFIPLEAGGLAIAIGDVSGKGIPAALLMATLRAYLRGQTVTGQSDLAALMVNLNRLVYESSASNRYATFFYGQYDPATRVLKYVNAGHNPPMLFKPSGTVVRLDVGGPVVGLLPDCRYAQGCVVLEPDDLLVGFTDGVSEAMNSDMDEWGEDRLAAAVIEDPARSPRELMDHLMQEADRFVSGAPQHDDMTLVVVKRTA
jgi:phosphoserine phosphatase RsbU/P